MSRSSGNIPRQPRTLQEVACGHYDDSSLVKKDDCIPISPLSHANVSRFLNLPMKLNVTV